MKATRALVLASAGVLLLTAAASADVVRRMVRIGPGFDFPDRWCPLGITVDATNECAAMNSKPGTSNRGPYEVTFVAPPSGRVDLSFATSHEAWLDNIILVPQNNVLNSGVTADTVCYKGSDDHNPSARAPTFDIFDAESVTRFVFAELFDESRATLQGRGWTFTNTVLVPDQSATDQVVSGDAASVSRRGSASGSLRLDGTAGAPAIVTMPAQVVPGALYTLVAWWNLPTTTDCGSYASAAASGEDLAVTVRTSDPRKCVGAIKLGKKVNGQWASGCLSAHRPGTFVRYYTFSLTRKTKINVTVSSNAADAYVSLLSMPPGGVLAEDDDSGGGSDASLTKELNKGAYALEVTTADPGESGAFSVTVAAVP